MKFFSKRAQSTAEYAIVIALVIGAAIAMQVYVRRGLQGGLKFATDKLRRDDNATEQYEPYYTQSETNTTRSGMYSSEEIKEGGGVERQTALDAANPETTTRGYKLEARNVTDAD